MAVAESRLRHVWPPTGWSALSGVSACAIIGGSAVLANSRPQYLLAISFASIFLFYPRACQALLVGAVLIAPTLNPVLLGLGPSGGGTVAGGRLYLMQGLLVIVVLCSLVVAARNGMHVLALKLVFLAVLLVLVETVGRPHAGLAWIYRPLQVSFVAFAVRALYRSTDDRKLLIAMGWGASIGCALATANALVPRFDPFVLSRPDNLPFVSLIGTFVRATGAFTYPNNLGTFAAYTVLLGGSSWLFERPSLGRLLAACLMLSGGSALLLSGSRSAGLGLLCGIIYITAKASPSRRAILIGAEFVVGLFVVLAVLSSPTASEVAQQRIGSSTGESAQLRAEGIGEALRVFRSAPLVGPGATESRTDNFWVLNLSQGGLIGAFLLLALSRLSLRASREPKRYPELWAALLVTLCVSGLLQDSLGQTLTTWFLGVLLGLAVLSPEQQSGYDSGRLATSAPPHS